MFQEPIDNQDEEWLRETLYPPSAMADIEILHNWAMDVTQTFDLWELGRFPEPLWKTGPAPSSLREETFLP